MTATNPMSGVGEPSKADLSPRQIRLVQSIADFQMALSAIDFMCEIDEDQLLTRVERRRHRCFEDAGVIAYGRAFTAAKGLPALSFKQLGLKPTEDQRRLHGRLLERRHRVVAHSDADRQRILFATERFEASNKTVMLPHVDFDDALAFYSDRRAVIEWLRTLIHAAGEVLFGQVQDLPELRFVRDHTLEGDPEASAR